MNLDLEYLYYMNSLKRQKIEIGKVNIGLFCISLRKIFTLRMHYINIDLLYNIIIIKLS